MTVSRSVLFNTALIPLVLAVTACGDPDATPDTSPYAGGEVDAGTVTEPDADPAPAAEPEGQEGEGLNPLEIAAREVCAAGDTGFSAPLPTDTAFASRGPDGRVHIAWNEGGETAEAIIPVVDLETEDRMAFEGAVADFIRHNLVSGFDRTGLTGAFRYRDGRFCVVQTEAGVMTGLQDATQTAQALLADG